MICRILCHLAAWFVVHGPDLPMESHRLADLVSLAAAVVTLNVFSRNLHLYQIIGLALLIGSGLHWVYSSDIATARTSLLPVAWVMHSFGACRVILHTAWLAPKGR